MPRCHLLVTLSLSCCEIKECHQSLRRWSILCADLFTPTRGPHATKWTLDGAVEKFWRALWSCQCCPAEGGARGEQPSKGQRAEQGSCLVLLLFVLLPLCGFFFVTSCVSYGHQRRSLASKGELRELGSFSKAKCAGEAAASSAMPLPIHLTPAAASLCVRPCPGVMWDPWVCR